MDLRVLEVVGVVGVLGVVAEAVAEVVLGVVANSLK